MSTSISCEPCREIRIRRISENVFSDIKNIKNKKGITSTKMLIPMVVEFANSFPEYMKSGESQPHPNKTFEIRLRGVSKKTKQALENVARYIGVNVEDLLKMKLAMEANSYPAYMKSEMIK